MEMIQGQLMYVAASFVEGVFLMFLCETWQSVDSD